jgi:hypothetical protein
VLPAAAVPLKPNFALCLGVASGDVIHVNTFPSRGRESAV